MTTFSAEISDHESNDQTDGNMGDNIHSGGTTTPVPQDLVAVIAGLQRQLQQMEERQIEDLHHLKERVDEPTQRALATTNY